MGLYLLLAIDELQPQRDDATVSWTRAKAKAGTH
jgi:hypothetical protein